MRDGKPGWYLTSGRPRGRNPRRRRGPASESEASPGANERICRYANFLVSVQTRCTTHAAALLAFVMSEALWALALRPEHHPRSDQSGHVEQPACGTRCPKEPPAQRSCWHLQRSPPAQSEDLPTLSDDERLLYGRAIARAPRRRARRAAILLLPRSNSLLQAP